MLIPEPQKSVADWASVAANRLRDVLSSTKLGFTAQNYEIRLRAPRKRLNSKHCISRFVIKYLLIQNENEKCLGETVSVSTTAHEHGRGGMFATVLLRGGSSSRAKVENESEAHLG